MPWLLLAGTAIGLALAASGLLERDGGRNPLPPDVVAVVGDRAIRRIDYERTLAGVERDRRGPIDEGTRRRVLERMIDEELLVQQALALGLASADRRVRGELVSGLVDSIVAGAEREPPSAEAVERHYRSHLDFFTRPGRQRVETLFFGLRRESPRRRAEAARERLVRGEEREAVARALADPPVLRLPDDLLPVTKLRDYLGPAVVEALGTLEVGVWSAPLETAEGWRLVRVVEREPEQAPPFEEIEAIVRSDLVRRRGDAALREYLDALRDQTSIERDASQPADSTHAGGGRGALDPREFADPREATSGRLGATGDERIGP